MNNFQIATTLSICLLGLCAVCNSQQPAEKKLKVYNAIITTAQQKQKLKGVLLDVQDSSVTIISMDKTMRVPATSITDIKIKRKGAVGRGAAVGGLTGMGLGFIIGLASGDDECPQGSWCIYQATAEEKALAGGLVFGLGGSIVGVIIGGVSRAEKIDINRDLKVFQANVERMSKYDQIR